MLRQRLLIRKGDFCIETYYVSSYTISQYIQYMFHCPRVGWSFCKLSWLDLHQPGVPRWVMCLWCSLHPKISCCTTRTCYCISFVIMNLIYWLFLNVALLTIVVSKFFIQEIHYHSRVLQIIQTSTAVEESASAF